MDGKHEILENDQDENCETRKEQWKCTQDKPRFSHRDNKCLNCARDHTTCDCPMRKQHLAPTTSNPASGTGTFHNINQFQNMSNTHNNTFPQQQKSQQSQSMVGITTPTLVVNGPSVPQSLQAQPPQINHSPGQIRPSLNHPIMPPINPMLTPPPAFNTQIPPPYFPQYPPSNSPSVGSTDSSILAALQKQWERQGKQMKLKNKRKKEKG